MKMHNANTVGGWAIFQPEHPMELQLADMCMIEYQSVYMNRARLEVRDVFRVVAQFEAALKLLRDEDFILKLNTRLNELGIKDFNTDDMHHRLLSDVIEFYLMNPAGASRVHYGIKLLEELINIDQEDFGSAYCLANAKADMGKPEEAEQIARRALEIAISKGFMYNAARLGCCVAKSIIVSAHGNAYSHEEVKSLVDSARTRIDSCKFWLPAVTYDASSSQLLAVEHQVELKAKGMGPRSTTGRLTTTVFPQVINRRCARCGQQEGEMSACARCRNVHYCSRKW